MSLDTLCQNGIDQLQRTSDGQHKPAKHHHLPIHERVPIAFSISSKLIHTLLLSPSVKEIVRS